MFAAEDSDHSIDRKVGCAVLGKRFLKLLLFLLFAAFLAALLLPTNSCPPGKPPLDKFSMANVAAALAHFHLEYGKWPIESSSDALTTTEGLLLLSLLAQDHATNLRGIKFIDLQPVQKGRPGLTGDPPTLVDSWGQPYHIILDTNNDGQVPNPEATADPDWKVKVHATDTLKARAAIYSSGPDRNPNTWEDNITNWR
jgi:hypothetical protein